MHKDITVILLILAAVAFAVAIARPARVLYSELIAAGLCLLTVSVLLWFVVW